MLFDAFKSRENDNPKMFFSIFNERIIMNKITNHTSFNFKLKVISTAILLATSSSSISATTIIEDGDEVSSIYSNDGDEIIVDGAISMTANENSPQGMVLMTGGKVDLGSGSKIVVQTDNTQRAAIFSMGGELKADNLEIDVNSDNYALYLMNTNAALTGLTFINMLGLSDAMPLGLKLVNTSFNAENILINYEEIGAASDNSDDIIWHNYDSSKINVTGNVNIISHRESTDQLENLVIAGNSQANFEKYLMISSYNLGKVVGIGVDSGAILNAGSIYVQISSENDTAHGVYVKNGEMHLSGDAHIIVTDGNASASGIGLSANQNSIVSIAGNTIISTGTDVTEQSQVLASVSNNSLLSLNGNVFLGSELNRDRSNVYALKVDANSSADFHGGLVHAIGNISASNNSLININATTNQSYIYSNIVADESSTINLVLNGSASQWDMSGSSTLTSLSLNDATLNFINTLNPGTETFTHNLLTLTGDYSGTGGTIVMNTTLGNDNSPTDKIHIMGDTSGHTWVTVNNFFGSGDETNDGILLIKVDGVSDGVFEQKGRTTAGLYDYFLRKNGSDWFLTSEWQQDDEDTTNKPEAPEESDTPGGNDTPEANERPEDNGSEDKESAPEGGTNQPSRVQVIRPEAAIYSANLSAANSMFATRLHDRLGETHYIDALTGNGQVTSLWMRQTGSHIRARTSSEQLHSQSNRYVQQLGGDIASWTTDGADQYHLGLMAGYGTQRSSARNTLSGYRAKGSIDGYSTGLYATWLQNSHSFEGIYLDSWALYNWFHNSVKGDNIQQETWRSRGFTASVEAGYTRKLFQGEKDGYFIQPKVQTNWMGVKAKENTEANGTRVEGTGDGNLQTRFGLRAFIQHKDISRGQTFQPFIEANWIHNTKDFGVVMNGVTETQTGTRNAGELKTGVEGNLHRNLNLWGNVAQQVGGRGYSETSASLGLKVSF
ncbi:MAG TPA: autotransporter outer membrane beta-barrel domain-containing protein [Buttiauxella sp.]|jgi:autotransporter family porin